MPHDSSPRRLPRPSTAVSRRPLRAAPAAGWTLVELLVAAGIAASLLGLAAPAWGDWIAGAEAAAEAHRLATSLSLARSEAIKRGQRVNVCRAPDGKHCAGAGSWEGGWLVHVDSDADAANGPAEIVVRREPAARARLAVRANRPLDTYVSFNALGEARLVNGGLQMGTFTVCRAGVPIHKVILANSGRVRVEKSNEICNA